MEAKKKKKGKGKKKSSKESKDKTEKKEDKIIIPDYGWLNIEFAMKDFPTISFSVKLRTASTISQLLDLLKEKHGKMNEISLFDEKGNKLENVKKDDALREAFGIIGSADKENADHVKILYDFTPCNLHDPILLS